MYSFLAKNGGSNVERAMLFGSRPPPNDSLWAVAKSAGVKLVFNELGAHLKLRIDTGIVVALTEDAFTRANKLKDQFMLVLGQSDYAGAVRHIVEAGFHVDVVFWNHASEELKEASSNFIEMNPHFHDLCR